MSNVKIDQSVQPFHLILLHLISSPAIIVMAQSKYAVHSLRIKHSSNLSPTRRPVRHYFHTILMTHLSLNTNHCILIVFFAQLIISTIFSSVHFNNLYKLYLLLFFILSLNSFDALDLSII